MEMTVPGRVYLAMEHIDDVTVIDCGSTDRSITLLKIIEGIRILDLPRGSDYLDFMIKAIEDAGTRKCDIAVFFPGNDDLDPDRIPDIIGQMKKTGCDVLLVPRNKKKGLPGSDKLFGKFRKGKSGPATFDDHESFSDPQTPIRFYSRKAIHSAVLDRERNIQSFDEIGSLNIEEI